MAAWRSQLFTRQARDAGIDRNIVRHACQIAERTTAVHADLPPVFTLRHLAHLSGADYGFLRAIVSRRNPDPYRTFRVRKRRNPDERKRRFRNICVPDPGLMQVQKWICQNILALGKPHAASVAYSKGNKLVDAASVHCGARWLIKMDVLNFFESINEIGVYRVFRTLGYQPLIAFELARLCTRLGSDTHRKMRSRWHVNYSRTTIGDYNRRGRMGHLPQGAPTSPMLANLVVHEFDRKVAALADKNELAYTRYADDITLSSSTDLDRAKASAIIGEISKYMAEQGLSPNATKTRLVSPGSRRIVLGLLVDGPKPKLSREFKTNLRKHVYFVLHKNIGPAAHAKACGFSAITGLKNHLLGLAAYATQIEPDYGQKVTAQLLAASWPR